jgi:subtilisin family serine protease
MAGNGIRTIRQRQPADRSGAEMRYLCWLGVRRLSTALLAALLSTLGLSASPGAASPASGSPSASPGSPELTGNVIVLLDRGRSAAAAASAPVRTAADRAGASPAGRSVPQIGLITLHPPRGTGAAAFARRLRRLPGVASVELEHRYVPRAVTVPNDPALHTGSPPIEWELAREGFYRAWNFTHGGGALVGVIDTGINGRQPDLSSKIVAAVNTADLTSPRTDQVGHGTHVASLACAATDNAVGMAGAGYDCRLVVEKSDFSDSSIAAAIVDAAEHGVQAINMSFGPDTANPPPPPESEVRALDFAAQAKVVLVAAAADMPTQNQGDPADVLQPSGTGAALNRGLGLDVTAADAADQRASFAGYGSEISLAAYGAFDGTTGSSPSAAPPGIFGAFPGNVPCACRTALDGSTDWAYLEGTSMAAPQVAATAAMMRALNPYASLRDILRILKQTAQRPPGTGWNPNLGWGILDAGAALAATRVLDRLSPVARIFAPRVADHRLFTVRWTGHDRRHKGLVASGIARYRVYVRRPRGRWRLLAKGTHHSLKFRGRSGDRYEFEVIAIDRAGNRQRRPGRVSTQVSRTAG